MKVSLFLIFCFQFVINSAFSFDILDVNIEFDLNQDSSQIQITEKFKIVFKTGHGCMTQSRAESKEDALYNVDVCNAVKYELKNNGKTFQIFEQNDGKWFLWGEYEISNSYMDQAKGDKRYSFFTTDGSYIVYVPKTNSGPLVILDLTSEDYIHYVYDEYK